MYKVTVQIQGAARAELLKDMVADQFQDVKLHEAKCTVDTTAFVYYCSLRAAIQLPQFLTIRFPEASVMAKNRDIDVGA